MQFEYNHFVELTKFIKTKVAMRRSLEDWSVAAYSYRAAVACNLHTVILAWIVQILAGKGVATQSLGLTAEQLANPPA